MARIRTIKPGFFRSYDVVPLSYRARLTWIGLWTYVDDEGRGRDDARIIKGELWPLEDDVTWQEVEKDLTELSRSAHVVRYEVSGRHFLAIPTWGDHQVISRPTKSKLPAPNEGLTRDFPKLHEDSVSAQGVLPAGRGKGRGSGRGSGSGSVNAHLTAGVTFDDFWSVWPRKDKRKDAETAWNSAVKRADPARIVDVAAEYANHPHRAAKQFVPYGATWLRGDCWNDPMPEAPEPDRTTTRRHASDDALAFALSYGRHATEVSTWDANPEEVTS